MNSIEVPDNHPDYEVVNSLNKFFSRKQWYAGGPIPPELIHTKRNYNLVKNIDIVHAIDIGYNGISKTMKNNGKLARTQRELDLDIYLALRVIHQCERMGIPQDYIGGLFLLYLELCEKVELQ